MAGTRLQRGMFCAALVAGLAGAGGAVGVGVASAGSSFPSTLTGGQTLASGAALQSPDAHYALTMQSGGDLVESVRGRTLWSSATSSPGAQAVLQPNNELIVQSSSGQTLWSDNASGGGCDALNVLDDGRVAVEGTSAPIWETSPNTVLDPGDTLQPGEEIFSPNEDYDLRMQTDGNLVLYNASNTALWETETNGHPGAYAIMQTDGNLVIYDGPALWSSGTHGDDDDASLAVQSDGNVVIYDSAGSAVWSTGTHDAAPGSGDPVPPPQYGTATACPATPAPAPATPATTTSSPAPAATVTVTAPTSTTLTVAAPVPETHLTRTVSVPVAFDWTWRGAFSYVRHVAFIHRVPAGLTVSVTITPARTAHRRARPSVETATTARGREELLVRLEHDRFSVGESLALEIAHRGYRPQTNTFRIRLHATPAVEGSVVRKPTTRHR